MSTNVKNEGFPLAAIRQISSPEITAIYGGTVTIPDGWELVAAQPRLPEKGEHWVSSVYSVPRLVYYATKPGIEDRLIVRETKVVEAAKPKPKVPFSTVSGGMAWTATTTVKDIYGVDAVEIPEGYRYVAFRVPKQGARELGVNKVTREVIAYTMEGDTEPRIIVEKVEPPKPTYEFVIHTVETPGGWEKVRYMATQTQVKGSPMLFYCEKRVEGELVNYVSNEDAPVLYLDSEILGGQLKRNFPGCTVRRAKTL